MGCLIGALPECVVVGLCGVNFKVFMIENSLRSAMYPEGYCATHVIFLYIFSSIVVVVV